MVLQSIWNSRAIFMILPKSTFEHECERTVRGVVRPQLRIFAQEVEVRQLEYGPNVPERE